jgi:glycosyltransferase involved in cell wall biosynthesis
MPEVVIDGETGFLLPVGDVDAMSERAIAILSDPILQRRLGKRGRELAASLFDEALIVPQYREMYERVMAGAQR